VNTNLQLITIKNRRKSILLAIQMSFSVTNTQYSVCSIPASSSLSNKGSYPDKYKLNCPPTYQQYISACYKVIATQILSYNEADEFCKIEGINNNWNETNSRKKRSNCVLFLQVIFSKNIFWQIWNQRRNMLLQLKLSDCKKCRFRSFQLSHVLILKDCFKIVTSFVYCPACAMNTDWSPAATEKL